MFTRITGKHENKPTIIVEFFENGHSLLYLDGTEPFIRKGLTLEKAQQVILGAGYSITIEEITNPAT